MEEFLLVNQPPPTPVESSVVGTDKPLPSSTKTEVTAGPNKANFGQEKRKVEKHIAIVDNSAAVNGNVDSEEKGNIDESSDAPKIEVNVSETFIVENTVTEAKSMEIGPTKKVNFSDLQTPNEDNTDDVKGTEDEICADGRKDVSDESEAKTDDTNVVFFVTEEGEESEKVTETAPYDDNDEVAEDSEITAAADDKTETVVENGEGSVNNEDSNDESAVKETNVEDVIKVEISEAERKTATDEEEQQPVTSETYPFDEEN